MGFQSPHDIHLVKTSVPPSPLIAFLVGHGSVQ